jgi:hypothetical protein
MEGQQPQSDLFGSEVKIDETARRHIAGLAQWAMIIVVTAVIGYAISLLKIFSGRTEPRSASNSEGFEAYFTMGSDNAAGAVFTIVIGLIANYFLYRFAEQSKKSLISLSNTELAAGIRNLKIYFVVITVIMIIAVMFTIIMAVAFA